MEKYYQTQQRSILGLFSVIVTFFFDLTIVNLVLQFIFLYPHSKNCYSAGYQRKISYSKYNIVVSCFATYASFKKTWFGQICNRNLFDQIWNLILLKNALGYFILFGFSSLSILFFLGKQIELDLIFFFLWWIGPNEEATFLISLCVNILQNYISLCDRIDYRFFLKRYI